MFKKIILLFGILLFSNSAVATDIGVDPEKFLQNLQIQFILKIRNSQATVLQFQKAMEKGDIHGVSEIAKKCAEEINKRIEKDRKISGNDYITMYVSCQFIVETGSLESWREEWVNYDYANHKATPRELLVHLYYTYIFLKFCYLNREEYQIQYITYNEFENYKKIISKIEKSLQDSLIDISLENLWDSTMGKFKGAEIISSAKKDTTYDENLKITCQGAKEEFYVLMSVNLPTQKLKKDF